MEVSKLPATLTLSTLLESGGDRTALNAYLQTFPHAEQLETLTNILSQYTGMDERVAAVISSIWDYICDNQIWVSKYQSLVDYQAEIHFNDLIKPIVKRHRGIERNKSTSRRIILQYWKLPVQVVLPVSIHPPFWSKHLLALLAALSKVRDASQAAELLAGSLRSRPRRGRNQTYIMANDVQRLLDGISGTSAHERNRKRNASRSLVAKDKCGTCRLEQNEEGSNLDEQPSIQQHLGESSSMTFGKEGIGNVQTESSHLVSLTSIAHGADLPCCDCSSICFPLITLISTGYLAKSSIMKYRTVRWIQIVSWQCVCDFHLRALADIIMGPSLDNPCRVRLIRALETYYGCHITISPTKSVPALTGMASRQQLFARLTDLSLSLEMWEQTGVLYMPAFFDYLREAGIFQRVELILSKIRPEERVSITQKCYDLLCETIKQDPAYYALVVACREDQNWRLLHRPEITAPHGSIMKLDDVTFSVANHQLQQMVEENEKGDIQSTVIFPSAVNTSKLRVLPCSGENWKTWIKNSHPSELSPNQWSWSWNENMASCFGDPLEISAHVGDLIITQPHTLRWPYTFASNNVINISQSRLDNNCETLENGLEGWWAQLAISKNSPRYGEICFGTRHGTLNYHMRDHIHDELRIGAKSALGEALTGLRKWTDKKVISECNLVLGLDDIAAATFIRRVRTDVLLELNQVLNMLENSTPDTSDNQLSNPGSPPSFLG